MNVRPEHLDALQELLNIGVGRAAGSLNQMLEKPIRLQVPFLRVGNSVEISQEILKKHENTFSSVQLPFKGKFQGSTCLLFPKNSAATLVTALTGGAEETDPIYSLREGSLTEIGNIVLNGVMGSFANFFHHQITYSVPFFQETSIQGLLQTTPSDTSEIILWAKAEFMIDQHNIIGEIMLLLGISDLSLLINTVSEFIQSTTPSSCTLQPISLT